VGKPYQSELSALPDTYRWALSYPLGELSEAVKDAAQLPLIAVGSGGSLTTAHFAALLHAEATGALAIAMTPLELVATDTILRDLAVVFITAGGMNPDIIGAFRRVVSREPKRLVVICARKSSPLVGETLAYESVRTVDFELPCGKDGFLATNSLLATATLLKRSYDSLQAGGEPIPIDLERLYPTPPGESSAGDLPRHCRPLWDRDTLTVLYGPTTKPAAIDLESRFTEAAIGHVQLADYRNFAHGRHHWMAKHPARTAVLSFESNYDRELADRTLALLPQAIPVVRLTGVGTGSTACLSTLLASIQIAGLAGQVRGIDPGAPRIPPFGREIYHIRAFRTAPEGRTRRAASDDVAIERKTGMSVHLLASLGELDLWRSSFEQFLRRLRAASFAALVADYDGTLCDEKEVRIGLRDEVAAQIIRLLESGLLVGIATGRGESVRDDLRKAIPQDYWSRILVGYRNGCEIARLGDDGVPSLLDELGIELVPIATRLVVDELLSRWVERSKQRPRQLTLYPRPGVHLVRLWRRAFDLVREEGCMRVQVLRSSHSVDVVAGGVSKRRLFDRLQQQIGASAPEKAILCMGDRGCWPGNDYDLLSTPYSLSVDEVSPSPGSCWCLSTPGIRGVAAGLEYLGMLACHGGVAKMKI
jgi:hypothetical protein